MRISLQTEQIAPALVSGRSGKFARLCGTPRIVPPTVYVLLIFPAGLSNSERKIVMTYPSSGSIGYGVNVWGPFASDANLQGSLSDANPVTAFGASPFAATGQSEQPVEVYEVDALNVLNQNTQPSPAKN
jgi:hypothetical protein